VLETMTVAIAKSFHVTLRFVHDSMRCLLHQAETLVLGIADSVAGALDPVAHSCDYERMRSIIASTDARRLCSLGVLISRFRIEYQKLLCLDQEHVLEDPYEVVYC